MINLRKLEVFYIFVIFIIAYTLIFFHDDNIQISRQDINGSWINYDNDGNIKLTISDFDCSLEINKSDSSFFYHGSCQFDLKKNPMIVSMKNVTSLEHELHSSFQFLSNNSILVTNFVNIKKAVEINLKNGKVFKRL